MRNVKLILGCIKRPMPQLVPKIERQVSKLDCPSSLPVVICHQEFIVSPGQSLLLD
jgi:hypothetical protein